MWAPHGPVGVLGIPRRRGQQAPALQRSRSGGVCGAATPTLAPTTSTPTFAPTTMVPTFAPTAPPTTPAPTTMVPTTLTPSGALRRHRRTVAHFGVPPRLPTAAAAAHKHTHTHAKCTQTHANAYPHIRTRTLTRTHARTRTHTHTHTDTLKYTRTHTRARARTHARTCMRTPLRGSVRVMGDSSYLLCSDSDEHGHVCADGLDREQGPRQRARLVRAN